MKAVSSTLVGSSRPNVYPSRINRQSIIVFAILVAGILIMPAALCAEPSWAKDHIKAAESLTFDADAPAAILFQGFNSKVTGKDSFDTECHIVCKVLTSQGVDQCRLVIPVYGGMEVNGLRGWRVRPNSEEERLEKSSIVEVGLAEAAGYHDDSKTVIAAFPTLQTGDIVVFEYSIKGRHIWDGYHRQYVVQEKLPVVSTTIEVTIPDGWILRSSSRHCQPLIFHQAGNEYTWAAPSLPYRPDEPHMLPAARAARILEVSCFSPDSDRAQYHRDWRGVSQWALDLYEAATEPDSSIKRVTSEVCAGAASRPDSIEAVCEFVRDRIRYVAVELGEGRFRPRNATETCFNKYGDCKDKVTLARALLKSIDVPSYPVLASVGTPIDPEFPSPFQFNHVILSIPCDIGLGLDSTSDAYADRSIYFDPTDESTAFGQLPTSLHGAHVLRISPSDSDLVELPAHRPEDYRRMYSVTANIDENFAVLAHVRLTDYGYQAAQAAYWREQNGEGKEKEQIIKVLSDNLSKPSISNFTSGSDVDSAWVEFNVTAGNYANRAGPMAISRLDFLPPVFGEKFTTDDRIHAIWFGKPSLVERLIVWTLPAGWTPTSSAATMADSCRIARAEGTTSFHADTVRYHMTFTCLGDTLSSTEYDSARRFERSLNSILNQQLVLEKRGE